MPSHPQPHPAHAETGHGNGWEEGAATCIGPLTYLELFDFTKPDTESIDAS